jgi:ABC-type sugar transport system ATPase subunit
MTMADRIVVLRGGRVEQVGTPLDLYNQPVNRFVAGFIGSPQMNFLRARLVAGGTSPRVRLDASPEQSVETLGAPGASAADGAAGLVVGIRPEHVRLDAPGADGVQVPATIDRVERLGASSFLYCTLDSGERLTAHAPGQVAHANGDRLRIGLPASSTHVFEATGAERALAAR